MVIRPQHIILVLRRISCHNASNYRTYNQQISKFLTLQKANFHCTARTCMSIFPVHKRQIETDAPDCGQPMEAWYYDVKRDGRLTVRSAMDVHIQPIDPQKHPLMNKLFINILYMGRDKLSSSELTTLTKQYIVNVDLDDKNEEMEISIKHKTTLPLPALCHLQVPIRYGIDVSCSKMGEASLENLESENVQVRTQKGNCKLKSIKGFNVNIKTMEGSVICSKVLQGNVKIACGGAGSIHVGRLQGQKVHCESDQGDITVKTVYAEDASFMSNCGNIHLGSCHGNSEISINEGHLTVDALDGNLTGSVSLGNTQISMAREGNINFEAEEGDISLKVPMSVNCGVEVSGTQINTDDVTVHKSSVTEDGSCKKLTGYLSEGPEKGTIEAHTGKGKVHLGYYDWLSSLNLNGVK